jgi:hypothetical protein
MYKSNDSLFKRYKVLDQDETPFKIFEPKPEYVKQERNKFFASQFTYNPNLRPSHNNATNLLKAEQQLEDIDSNLPGTNLDNAERQSYHWLINEDLTTIRMVLAASVGDWRRFQNYNHTIYGDPDREIFAAVCDWFAYDASKVVKNGRAEIVEAAEELINAIGQNRGDRSILVPNAITFQATRKREYNRTGFMTQLLKGVTFPISGMVDTVSGDLIILRMLSNMHCKQKIQDALLWSVNEMTFRRPPHYVMSTQEFIEFTSHEFRHLTEYRNQASKVFFNSAEHDQFTQHSEGRCVVTEEITNPTFELFSKGRRWYELLGRHLTVSLSCGLGGKNKSFSETFLILRNAFIVYEASRSDSSESFDELCKFLDNIVWDLLVSVYEGTDGSGEGGGWRRPMVYLEGSIDVWHEETEYPGYLELGDSQKFGSS